MLSLQSSKLNALFSYAGADFRLIGPVFRCRVQNLALHGLRRELCENSKRILQEFEGNYSRIHIPSRVPGNPKTHTRDNPRESVFLSLLHLILAIVTFKSSKF